MSDTKRQRNSSKRGKSRKGKMKNRGVGVDALPLKQGRARMRAGHGQEDPDEYVEPPDVHLQTSDRRQSYHNLTCVPYRTPACDKHLDRNEDAECPWCKPDKVLKKKRHLEKDPKVTL